MATIMPSIPDLLAMIGDLQASITSLRKEVKEEHPVCIQSDELENIKNEWEDRHDRIKKEWEDRHDRAYKTMIHFRTKAGSFQMQVKELRQQLIIRDAIFQENLMPSADLSVFNYDDGTWDNTLNIAEDADLAAALKEFQYSSDERSEPSDELTDQPAKKKVRSVRRVTISPVGTVTKSQPKKDEDKDEDEDEDEGPVKG